MRKNREAKIRKEEDRNKERKTKGMVKEGRKMKQATKERMEEQSRLYKEVEVGKTRKQKQDKEKTALRNN